MRKFVGTTKRTLAGILSALMVLTSLPLAGVVSYAEPLEEIEEIDELTADDSAAEEALVEEATEESSYSEVKQEALGDELTEEEVVEEASDEVSEEALGANENPIGVRFIDENGIFEVDQYKDGFTVSNGKVTIEKAPIGTTMVYPESIKFTLKLTEEGQRLLNNGARFGITRVTFSVANATDASFAGNVTDDNIPVNPENGAVEEINLSLAGYANKNNNVSDTGVATIALATTVDNSNRTAYSISNTTPLPVSVTGVTALEYKVATRNETGEAETWQEEGTPLTPTITPVADNTGVVRGKSVLFPSVEKDSKLVFTGVTFDNDYTYADAIYVGGVYYEQTATLNEDGKTYTYNDEYLQQEKTSVADPTYAKITQDAANLSIRCHTAVAGFNRTAGVDDLFKPDAADANFLATDGFENLDATEPLTFTGGITEVNYGTEEAPEIVQYATLGEPLKFTVNVAERLSNTYTVSNVSYVPIVSDATDQRVNVTADADGNYTIDAASMTAAIRKGHKLAIKVETEAIANEYTVVEFTGFNPAGGDADASVITGLTYQEYDDRDGNVRLIGEPRSLNFTDDLYDNLNTTGDNPDDAVVGQLVCKIYAGDKIMITGIGTADAKFPIIKVGGSTVALTKDASEERKLAGKYLVPMAENAKTVVNLSAKPLPFSTFDYTTNVDPEHVDVDMTASALDILVKDAIPASLKDHTPEQLEALQDKQLKWEGNATFTLTAIPSSTKSYKITAVSYSAGSAENVSLLGDDYVPAGAGEFTISADQILKAVQEGATTIALSVTAVEDAELQQYFALIGDRTGVDPINDADITVKKATSTKTGEQVKEANVVDAVTGTPYDVAYKAALGEKAIIKFSLADRYELDAIEVDGTAISTLPTADANGVYTLEYTMAALEGKNVTPIEIKTKAIKGIKVAQAEEITAADGVYSVLYSAGTTVSVLNGTTAQSIDRVTIEGTDLPEGLTIDKILATGFIEENDDISADGHSVTLAVARGAVQLSKFTNDEANALLQGKSFTVKLHLAADAADAATYDATLAVSEKPVAGTAITFAAEGTDIKADPENPGVFTANIPIVTAQFFSITPKDETVVYNVVPSAGTGNEFVNEDGGVIFVSGLEGNPGTITVKEAADADNVLATLTIVPVTPTELTAPVVTDASTIDGYATINVSLAPSMKEIANRAGEFYYGGLSFVITAQPADDDSKYLKVANVESNTATIGNHGLGLVGGTAVNAITINAADLAADNRGDGFKIVLGDADAGAAMETGAKYKVSVKVVQALPGNPINSAYTTINGSTTAIDEKGVYETNLKLKKINKSIFAGQNLPIAEIQWSSNTTVREIEHLELTMTMNGRTFTESLDHEELYDDAAETPFFINNNIIYMNLADPEAMLFGGMVGKVDITAYAYGFTGQQAVSKKYSLTIKQPLVNVENAPDDEFTNFYVTTPATQYVLLGKKITIKSKMVYGQNVAGEKTTTPASKKVTYSLVGADGDELNDALAGILTISKKGVVTVKKGATVDMNLADADRTFMIKATAADFARDEALEEVSSSYSAPITLTAEKMVFGDLYFGNDGEPVSLTELAAGDIYSEQVAGKFVYADYGQENVLDTSNAKYTVSGAASYKNGVFEVKKPGKVKVTVTAKDGSKKNKKTYTFTIKSVPLNEAKDNLGAEIFGIAGALAADENGNYMNPYAVNSPVYVGVVGTYNFEDRDDLAASTYDHTIKVVSGGKMQKKAEIVRGISYYTIVPNAAQTVVKITDKVSKESFTYTINNTAIDDAKTKATYKASNFFAKDGEYGAKDQKGKILANMDFTDRPILAYDPVNGVAPNLVTYTIGKASDVTFVDVSVAKDGTNGELFDVLLANSETRDDVERIRPNIFRFEVVNGTFAIDYGYSVEYDAQGDIEDINRGQFSIKPGKYKLNVTPLGANEKSKAKTGTITVQAVKTPTSKVAISKKIKLKDGVGVLDLAKKSKNVSYIEYEQTSTAAAPAQNTTILFNNNKKGTINKFVACYEFFDHKNATKTLSIKPIAGAAPEKADKIGWAAVTYQALDGTVAYKFVKITIK